MAPPSTSTAVLPGAFSDSQRSSPHGLLWLPQFRQPSLDKPLHLPLTALPWSALDQKLSWDEFADGLIVDTSEKYITIVIPADQEKGGKNRVYPVSPEFSEMLLSVPPAERQGFVFNPIPSRILKGNQRAGQDLCCRTIGSVGEAAGVVVDRKGDKTPFLRLLMT